VRGSLEPLKVELEKLEHKEVQLNLLYATLGAVTQSDVDAAIASNAVIIGFHVLSESAARKSAERAGVQIRHYNVIYEVVDDLKAALENMLAPEQKEKITGHAEIRQLFASSKFGNVAGCFVVDGFVRRADYIRIYREGRLIYGTSDKPVQVDSLRRIKDDVREVREGFECGIRISAYQDIKEGDVIEFYEIKEHKRTLES
jgi:translation initiation factor IF-2